MVSAQGTLLKPKNSLNLKVLKSVREDAALRMNEELVLSLHGASKDDKIYTLKMLSSIILPTMSKEFFIENIIERGLRGESDPDVLLVYFRALKGIIMSLGICGALVSIILEKISEEWENDLKAIAYDCLYYACKVDHSFYRHSGNRHAKQMILRSLVSHHYLERLCALRLFVHLYFKGESMEYSIDENVRLLVKFCSDEDHRVRKMALELLMDDALDGLSVYQSALKGLKDDYEGVRKASANLIHYYSCKRPDSMVILENGEQIRMIDDAFVKVCDLMNDPSLEVRVQAANLLGKFVNVSDSFLLQTFSKEVMSHLKRKRRLLEVSSEIKSFDAGSESLDEYLSQEFRLLDFGAAGAFIHAFEDEFSVVRHHSISSIRALAEGSETFAKASIEYLIDMMNDEIDDVRCNSLDVMCHLAQRYVLLFPMEHLKVVVGGLDDANPFVRENTRALIKVCKIMDFASLQMCFKTLKTNLRRYPDDRLSIFQCAGELGFNNGHFVRGEFLKDFGIMSERYRINPEPIVTEEFHSLSVIMIANACFKNNKLITLLPVYFARHASHLFLLYKECFHVSSFVPFGLKSLLPVNSNAAGDPEIILKTASINIHKSKSIEEAIIIVKEAKRLLPVTDNPRYFQFVLDGLEFEYELRIISGKSLPEMQLSKLRSLLSVAFALAYIFHGKNSESLSLYWRIMVASLSSHCDSKWIEEHSKAFDLKDYKFGLKFISEKDVIGNLKCTITRPDETLKTRSLSSQFPNSIKVSGQLYLGEGYSKLLKNLVISIIYPDLTIRNVPLLENLMKSSVNGEYFFDQKVYLVSKRKWTENPIHFCLAVTMPAALTDIKGWEIELLEDVFYLGEGSVKHLFDRNAGLAVRLSDFKRIYSTSN